MRGTPPTGRGDGHAAGDFALAHVLAPEYAHNLQQELGVFDNSVTPNARPFELQADCMAGVWAYSVFAKGDLERGDIQEATTAAQHHGTPEERPTRSSPATRAAPRRSAANYLPLS